MRLKSLALAFTLSGLALAPPAATAQAGAKDDGKIVEQARFEPPAFEQVPDRFRRLYGREAIERVRDSPESAARTRTTCSTSSPSRGRSATWTWSASSCSASRAARR